MCELAILGLNDWLPWRAAKVCFQNQRDFNYLEARHLWEDARVDADGIHIAGMCYRALILEADPPAQARPAIDTLARAGRIIRWTESSDSASLVAQIDKLISPDVQASPASSNLRVRHVRKANVDYYLLFNEAAVDLECRLTLSVKGKWLLLDPMSGLGEVVSSDNPVRLAGHAMQVLVIET